MIALLIASLYIGFCWATTSPIDFTLLIILGIGFLLEMAYEGAGLFSDGPNDERGRW